MTTAELELAIAAASLARVEAERERDEAHDALSEALDLLADAHAKMLIPICVHCGEKPGENAKETHWSECPKHPARPLVAAARAVQQAKAEALAHPSYQASAAWNVAEQRLATAANALPLARAALGAEPARVVYQHDSDAAFHLLTTHCWQTCPASGPHEAICYDIREAALASIYAPPAALGAEPDPATPGKGE